MAYHYLSLNAHAGHHMAPLPVTVGGLVLIHEIHVNGIVRDFLVKLGM